MSAVGVGTRLQVADIFTKGLERDQFRALREVLTGHSTYNQLVQKDGNTVSKLRRLQQSEYEREDTFVTDSEYSYRL